MVFVPCLSLSPFHRTYHCIVDASCVMTPNDVNALTPNAEQAPLLADRKAVRHQARTNQELWYSWSTMQKDLRSRKRDAWSSMERILWRKRARNDLMTTFGQMWSWRNGFLINGLFLRILSYRKKIYDSSVDTFGMRKQLVFGCFKCCKLQRKKNID